MIAAFQFDNLPLSIVLLLVISSVRTFAILWAGRLRLKYASNVEIVDENTGYAPRFLKMNFVAQFYSLVFYSWFFGSLGLALLWWSARDLVFPELFTVAVGFLLLFNFVQIAQTISSIMLFNALRVAGGYQGQIRYTRQAVLGQSIGLALGWGLTFAFIFLLTGNWLFVGGTLRCLVAGIRFARQSAKIRLVVLQSEATGA